MAAEWAATYHSTAPRISHSLTTTRYSQAMFYKKFAVVVLIVAPVLAMAASELSRRAPEMTAPGRPASVPIDKSNSTPQPPASPVTPPPPPPGTPTASTAPLAGQPFAGAGMPMVDPMASLTSDSVPKAATPPPQPGEMTPFGETPTIQPKSGLNGGESTDMPN